MMKRTKRHRPLKVLLRTLADSQLLDAVKVYRAAGTIMCARHIVVTYGWSLEEAKEIAKHIQQYEETRQS